MKKIIALLAIVGSTSGVHAAGTLGFAMVPRDSSIGSGESVIIDIYTDRDEVIGALYMAGFKFDVIGHSNGTLVGDVSNEGAYPFNQGTHDGTPSGADLLNFSGGRLPDTGHHRPPNPEFLGTVTYTDSGVAASNYTVTLSIVDYVSPAGSLNVFLSASGTQSRSSYTGNTGTNHLVHFDIGSFEVVVPAPGSVALFGTGGVAVVRRRR